jgi:hypothetical protein
MEENPPCSHCPVRNSGKVGRRFHLFVILLFVELVILRWHLFHIREEKWLYFIKKRPDFFCSKLSCVYRFKGTLTRDFRPLLNFPQAPDTRVKVFLNMASK